ncbi:MAG: PAS domain S-box protein [bacterium]|nr:PAS domain S-box protein [bacterium]
MQQSTEILIDQIPLGILTFSFHGRVEFINQNFHKLGLLYQFNTSLLNINIFKYNIFPPVNIIEELKAVVKGRPFEKEIKHIKTSDGRLISLIVKGSPIYEEENITSGMLIIEDLQFLSENGDTSQQKLTTDFINKGEIFLIVTDSSGDIKYSAGKEIQGSNLLRREITGRNLNDIFTTTPQQKVIDSFNNAVQFGKAQFLQLEFDIENKIKKYDCTIEPVIGENGFVQILYLIFKESPLPPEEIDAMVERLRKLDYYQEISRKTDSGIFLIKGDGTIFDWDKQFEQICGMKRSEAILTINDLFPAINKNELLNLIQQLNDFNTCEISTFLLKKNLERFPVKLDFYRGHDVDAEAIVLCKKIKLDTAIFQQTWKNREEPQPHLEISQPMCRIGIEGSIILANSALSTLTGYQKNELLFNNFFSFITEDDVTRLNKEISTLFSGEKKLLPITLKDKNSNQKDLLIILEAAEVIDGKLYTVNCFFEKPQFTPIADSENIYKSLFSASKDGMAVELDEVITMVNDSFAKIFGYETAKQLENRNILELVNEESIPAILDYLKSKRESQQGKERIEFLARKKDGSSFHAEFYAFKLEKKNQPYLIFVAKDISERKRMQEAAKDSEQKYRNIAENIEDLLYTFERIDDKMMPTYFSNAIEKITGYTQTEFLTDHRLFLKIVHPDDFSDMKKRLAFLWKSEKQSAGEFELRIINKSGNIVWVRNKINFIRDAEGNIHKIYGLVSDITFNKKAEEELKQSAANLKKLNDAKDRFLSIISHDLRAPFSSILGFTDLLLEDETLTDVERQQYISYIQDSSKSMLALVNSMLDWTRLQTGRIKFEPEKLNAREIIESSISTVSGTALKKGVEIENLVDPGLHIFGDKNLILQVFNNLLSNAVKFTKLGDRIMISVNVSSTSRFITFSVKDTGVGIKANNLEKLFSIETKFTSEGTAGEKGSGLGLSLVKDIIEKHGGSIDVKSEFGKGTEFIFTIPVASTKILLVDPNTRERMFYSKVLINITSDYAINVVSNGKEALERIIQSPPALVITEHKMPIMGGLALVRELIKNNLRETIPIIILSGEIDRAEIQEYTELGVEYIFNKPVNLISLKTAIEKSLRKRNK